MSKLFQFPFFFVFFDLALSFFLIGDLTLDTILDLGVCVALVASFLVQVCVGNEIPKIFRLLSLSAPFVSLFFLEGGLFSSERDACGLGTPISSIVRLLNVVWSTSRCLRVPEG